MRPRRSPCPKIASFSLSAPRQKLQAPLVGQRLQAHDLCGFFGAQRAHNSLLACCDAMLGNGSMFGLHHDGDIEARQHLDKRINAEQLNAPPH